MAIDLSDAVLEGLRGSACAGLFGDTWDPMTQSGTQKFFADYAASPSQPYAVVMEIGEQYEYMTSNQQYIPYIATGQLHVAIHTGGIGGRLQARQLGISVAAALNDAPLTWPACVNFMLLRLNNAVFVPIPETGPASPTAFLRLLTFDYQFQSFILQ